MTSVKPTPSRSAISQAVLTAPEPLALFAKAAIRRASSAAKGRPAKAIGVDLARSLKALPNIYAKSPSGSMPSTVVFLGEM